MSNHPSKPHWQQQIEPALRKRLRATAYHEAGHAVVSHILGFKVRSVTVLPRSFTKQECADLATHGFDRFAPGYTDVDYGAAEIRGQVTSLLFLRPWVMSYVAGDRAQRKGSPADIRPADAEHDYLRIKHETARLLGADAAQRVQRVTAERKTAATRAGNLFQAWPVPFTRATKSWMRRRQESCPELLGNNVGTGAYRAA